MCFFYCLEPLQITKTSSNIEKDGNFMETAMFIKQLPFYCESKMYPASKKLRPFHRLCAIYRGWVGAKNLLLRNWQELRFCMTQLQESVALHLCLCDCKIHYTENTAFIDPFQGLKISSKMRICRTKSVHFIFVGSSFVELLFEQLELGSVISYLFIYF